MSKVNLDSSIYQATKVSPIAVLDERLHKVAYYSRMYGHMRRGIIPHPVYLDESNVALLQGFDFVFICVDKPAVRKLLSEYLRAQGIPFVDTGMELELIEEEQSLIGTCRVTMSTPGKSDHFVKHVSLQDNNK